MGHLVLHIAWELVPSRGPIQKLALGFIETVAESHFLQQLQQQLQVLLGLDMRLKQQPNDMGRQEPMKQKALHIMMELGGSEQVLARCGQCHHEGAIPLTLALSTGP